MADETLEYRFQEKGLDDLRRDMAKLAEDFEDAGDEALDAADDMVVGMESGEEAVEDLERALNDIDTRQAITAVGRLNAALGNLDRKLDRLDGRSLDIDGDVDVDRDRVRGSVSGGGGARLPGELDEVGEAFRFLGSLSPKVLALGGAAVTATAAIAGGAGLAAAATSLAAQFGDQGIRRDLRKTKLQLRGAAGAISEEFEPVIRNQVVPAAQDLAQSVAGAADELASFSSLMLSLLGLDDEDENEGSDQPSVGGRLGIRPGLRTRMKGRAGNLEAKPFPGPQTVSPDRLQAMSGLMNKINMDVLEPMRREIAAIRDLPFINKKEELRRIRDLRQQALMELEKLQAKNPDIFPDTFIRRQLSKLEKVSEKYADATRPPVPAPAQPFKGPKNKTLEAPGVSFGKQLKLTKRARMQLRQYNRQQRRARVLGMQFSRTVGAGVRRLTSQVLSMRSGIDTVGQAFKRVGSVVVQALKRMIAKLASAVATAGVLRGLMAVIPGFGSIGGASAFSGILTNLLPSAASGGVLKDDMLVQAHKHEAIVPLDRLDTMLQTAAYGPPTVPAGATQGVATSGGGMNVTVNVTGQTRTEGRDIVTTYEQETRAQRRKGYGSR